VREQRVHQRAGLVPRRRVHDQAGRFVDDDQPAILVYDRQRQRLGLDRRRDGLGRRPDDDVSGLQLPRWCTRRSVHGHGRLSDLPRQLRARDLGHVVRQEKIQPLAGRVRRDHETP
jgi:hypothetical protein